jgi:DNA polymerase-3 subunit gamma/tau
MRKIALYRKYRPTKLGEVIGQEHITDVLAAALKQQQISHAYLLTGQRGTGKTSVARILAYEVNQLTYGEQSFDIIEIDAASHGLKEDIKDLIEKSVIAPVRDKYKVYIIDEIHSMKHDAFNTFLKLLEEPPEHVIFILATTDPQKLPPTILSRAQRFHFRPVEQTRVVEHLKHIAKNENIELTEDAARLIAAKGEGSFRDSISLLDQLSTLNLKVERDMVEHVLGLVPEQQINALAEAVLNNQPTEIVKLLAELKADGISGRTLVDQLIKRLLLEATAKPELFGLIDRLVDSVSAYDIYLKLLALLASSAIPEPKSTSTQPRQAESIVSEELKPKSKAAEQPPQPAPSEINWQKFLDLVSEKNKTCGSSLTGGSYDYDGETMTLYFKSRIFRDKMKDSKWRNILKNALRELYKSPPKILIADGQKPKNDTLAAVADIMGGGEVL